MKIEKYRPRNKTIEAIKFEYNFETLESNISDIKNFIEEIDGFYVSSIYFNEDCVEINVCCSIPHTKFFRLKDGCFFSRSSFATHKIHEAFQCISSDDMEFFYEKM